MLTPCRAATRIIQTLHVDLVKFLLVRKLNIGRHLKFRTECNNDFGCIATVTLSY